MAAYHFGYHQYPLDAADCPVCAEHAEAEGEEEAIAEAERQADQRLRASEKETNEDFLDAHYSSLERAEGVL